MMTFLVTLVSQRLFCRKCAACHVPDKKHVIERGKSLLLCTLYQSVKLIVTLKQRLKRPVTASFFTELFLNNAVFSFFERFVGALKVHGKAGFISLCCSVDDQFFV